MERLSKTGNDYWPIYKKNIKLFSFLLGAIWDCYKGKPDINFGCLEYPYRKYLILDREDLEQWLHLTWLEASKYYTGITSMRSHLFLYSVIQAKHLLVKLSKKAGLLYPAWKQTDVSLKWVIEGSEAYAYERLLIWLLYMHKSIFRVARSLGKDRQTIQVEFQRVQKLVERYGLQHFS